MPCVVTSTLKVLSKFWPTLDSSYLDHQSKMEGAKENEKGLQRTIMLRCGSNSTPVAGIRKGFSQGWHLSPGSGLDRFWVGRYRVCGMMVQKTEPWEWRSRGRKFRDWLGMLPKLWRLQNTGRVGRSRIRMWKHFFLPARRETSYCNNRTNIKPDFQSPSGAEVKQSAKQSFGNQ